MSAGVWDWHRGLFRGVGRRHFPLEPLLSRLGLLAVEQISCVVPVDQPATLLLPVAVWVARIVPQDCAVTLLLDVAPRVTGRVTEFGALSTRGGDDQDDRTCTHRATEEGG